MANKKKSPMDAGETPELKPKSAEQMQADENGQGVLLDTADPKHKPIIACARAVRKIGKERSEVQDRETKKRDELIELMHGQKLTYFRFGDIEVRIKAGSEKVSVKTASANGGDGDGDDADD